MDQELANLRERLEGIADELADLGLARLRDAVAAGAERPPTEEKLVTRARRSIDKAVSLLASAEDAASEARGT
jgi:hypothetical protein